MGLELLFSSKEKTLSPETKKLLDGYMAGAKKEIGFVDKNEAYWKAEKYASDFFKSGKADSLTTEDVKLMEKQVAKEIRGYGFKERLNYASNTKAKEETAFEMIGLKAAGLTVLGLGGAALDPDLGTPVVLAGYAALAVETVVRCASLPKDDAQAKKIEDYTDLKHAQLALKQLKREIGFKESYDRDVKRAEKIDAYKEDVKKLFAAGYGQPSGGLVQAPIAAAKLRNQGR
ncbi:MAG: hypothetical protein IJ752_04365 [Alphaproteobacteria bacterium]|nr:hypothetical protein [Alphaproteobacteria bacterium]